MKNLSCVLEKVSKASPCEPEFLNSVKTMLEFLEPIAEKHPEWIKANVFERFFEPERQIVFRVPWVDDGGGVQVNRGFRVQFNSAVGPYNGGVRFHPSVNIDVMKSLALEQTIKNALTGFPVGGAGGGSDFDPKGKSDGEIMRFCQSFMTELYRYIGENADILTGDIGVGEREIGFMFGQYKKMKNDFAGVMTGKQRTWGGEMGKKATGYGMGFFMEEALKAKGKTCKDATVVVSGCGDNAIYTTKKMEHLGAKVVTVSDAFGYLHDPDGITRSTITKKLKGAPLCEYVKFHPNAKYAEGCVGVWNVKCDVAFACADRGEINGQAANALVSNGCFAVGEVADNASTPEAAKIFSENKLVYVPSIPANAASAVASALEMIQNKQGRYWNYQEAHAKIMDIMADLCRSVYTTAKEYGFDENLRAGATIAAFMKIAEAMYAQGC